MLTRTALFILLLTGTSGTGLAQLAGCSGVPGDFRTPSANATRSEITHGPGTKNIPKILEKKAWDHLKPGVLYVLDDTGNHVILGHPLRKSLSEKDFEDAERVAFWGEIVGEDFYLVPNWDKCQIASHVGPELSLLAPEKGLLFLEFTGEGCGTCSKLDGAIKSVIGREPERNFSWVQINLTEK